MRCKKEDFVSGAIFHVYNHVIDNYDLFYDDEDYSYMISVMEENLHNIPGSVFAYCLMPNHYHFLIRQESDIEVYRLFNYTFITYAHYFNNKYDRKGPIFRSPLQHKIIDNDLYLLQLCKYIHLNPVRKNLVSHASEWLYSNYNDWITSSKEQKNSFIQSYTKILPEKYSNYVESCFNFLTCKEYGKLIPGI
jgi:REP-associated tyrosine transposase